MIGVVHDVEQRSDAWKALRLGRVTSSNVDGVFASRADKKEAAGRRNLRVQLVLERVCGRSMEREFPLTQAMQDGIDREADAALRYELQTGYVVSHVGFISHPELMVGASPDGVVGEWEGLIEVKCPIAATHWDFLRTGQVPLEYLRQIRQQQWLTGVAWTDFVSFQPDFPESLRLRTVRVPRDENVIAEHERQVRIFLDEVAREEAAVRTMADTAGQFAAAAGAA